MARRPTSLWLPAMLAFAVVSLPFLGRLPHRAPAAPGAPAAAGAAAPTNSAPLLLEGATSAGGALVFALPLRDAVRARPGTLRLNLVHDAAPAPCAIQVAVECDHHGSFGHLHQPDAVPASGFAFQAPLDSTADYWLPLDHTAAWSAWERQGLRRIEVKVFDLPPRTTVRLRAEYVPAPEPSAASLAWALPLADPVALGERWELAFDLDGLAANPFDESDTGLRLRVTQPDGREATILPFLYQNFETLLAPGGEKILPRGAKHFRARYRPTATGTHHYRLVRQAGEGTSAQVLADGTFTVRPGRLPPFIRVSPRNSRYFETLDGRFFYPIGWNLAFPSDTPYGVAYLPYLPREQSLASMRKMLEDLAASGGNCIRLWQSTWWNALEWGEGVDNYGGRGRYNLKNAWITDQVLDTCEQLGIHALFTMQNHTRFFAKEWPQHTLNRRNGGFLRRPTNFWYDERAVAPTRREMAYAIARFADSPACLSWDFISEVDNIVWRNDWRAVRDRTLGHLRYMKELDPYQRIVANHVCILTYDLPFFDEPLLEFIQSNAYSGLAGLSEDQLFAIRDYSTRFADKAKPVMVSECGGHWAGDPAGKMRRDTFGAIWAGVASRLSGVPQSWWWNFNYGENLGRLYRIVADFMAGEDLIAEDTLEAGGWRNRDVRCESAEGNLRALMVGNDARRFLFLFNFDTVCRTRLIPSRCASNTVAFAEMRPGRYIAEYWDPKTGPAGRSETVVVDAQGEGRLHPPDFGESWMVKLVRDTTAGLAAAATTVAAVPAPEGSSPPPPAGREPLSLVWEIEPLLPVRAEAATARAYVETHLALPAAGRGLFPAVTDAAGTPVPCDWEFLENQGGWLLRIPGTSTGPYKVTAVSRPPSVAWIFDPQSVGLEVEVVPWRGGTLPTAESFGQAFAASGGGRRTRMAALDQLENPLGGNDFFLAHYRGPLAIPADGRYRLALNSDDGGFLKLDGRVVVSWPGPHDMENINSPLSNTWSHNAELELARGMHWIECYHQEELGAQLARAGWFIEPAPATATDWNILDLVGATSTSLWQIIPEQALDGRIPCRVRVLNNGRRLAEVAECAGLRLRRPEVLLPSLLVVETPGAAPHKRYFSRGGRHEITVGGKTFPVWVNNTFWTPFSLEWEQGWTTERRPVLRTMLFDEHPPLRLRIGGRDAGEAAHAPGAWQAWPLGPGDRGAPLDISMAGIALARGRVAYWTAAGEPPPRQRRRPVPRRLLQPSSVLPPAPLTVADHANGQRGGTAPVTPEGVPFDIWSGDAASLRAILETRHAAGAGVVLELDRQPSVRGLDGDQVYSILQAHMRAVAEAGAVPVLVLGAGLDPLRNLEMRAQALAVARLRDESGCLMIDRRERP